MKKIILIGNGGHCKSCIDVIESTKKFKIMGMIDNNDLNIGKYKTIGSEKNLEQVFTIDLTNNPDNLQKIFIEIELTIEKFNLYLLKFS